MYDIDESEIQGIGNTRKQDEGMEADDEEGSGN